MPIIGETCWGWPNRRARSCSSQAGVLVSPFNSSSRTTMSLGNLWLVTLRFPREMIILLAVQAGELLGDSTHGIVARVQVRAPATTGLAWTGLAGSEARAEPSPDVLRDLTR